VTGRFADALAATLRPVRLARYVEMFSEAKAGEMTDLFTDYRTVNTPLAIQGCLDIDTDLH